MSKFNVLLIFGLVFFLAACAGIEDKEDISELWSVERLYAEAKGALDVGNYSAAVKYYEKLDAQYPFSVYAQQALLDLAYAYYKEADMDAAQAATERFIKLYPQNQHIDYVYYLKGVINFKRGESFIDHFFDLDPAQRDSAANNQSFQDFMTLIKRFPGSKYTADAKQRMIYLREQLAAHEINVAHYYLRKGAFVASANRAAYVVKNYPQTIVIPEALILMARNYKILGLDMLYNDALRVLKLNFPYHPEIDTLTELVVN